MTAYEQRCREACPEGCGKGLVRRVYAGDKVFRPFAIGDYVHVVGDSYTRCTAPTESQFAEEMAHELASLAEAYAHLPQLTRARITDLEAERDEWRDKFDSEHETRIKYQDIAYMVCNFLDVALGNSAKRGTCLPAEKDAIHLALVRLFHSQHQTEEPNAKR